MLHVLPCYGMKFKKNYFIKKLPKIEQKRSYKVLPKAGLNNDTSPEEFINNHNQMFKNSSTQFIKDEKGVFWKLHVNPETKEISSKSTERLFWNPKLGKFIEDKWYKIKKFFNLNENPALSENSDFHYPRTTFGFAASSIRSREGNKATQLQQRTKIAQEFSSFIQYLNNPSINIVLKNIRLSEIRKNKEYKISYFIGKREVGYQQYTIVDNKAYNMKVGYLASIHVDKEFRGYGLGKFLIKSAIADLKSKNVNIVWLRRGKGEHASEGSVLDSLFRAEGFRPWIKDSEIYELILNKPSLSNEEFEEAKNTLYEDTGLEDVVIMDIY